MIRVTLIVLCLGFTLTFCGRISTDIETEKINPSATLSEKIKIINSVLLKYDRELDRMVPFKEIRAAIRGMDLMARNYTGACIDSINKASHLGYQATDNYFRATDNIVNWCTSAENTFSYIIDNHSELEQDRIEKSVKRALKKGLVALKKSINTLETVVDQLSEMERVLRPVPDTLSKELKEIQLQHEHAVKTLRRTKMMINTALTAVGLLVGFVLSFYLGPVGGGAIGLGIKMLLTTIPTGIIEGKIVPSMEDKIKITEAYYLSLTQTVQQARLNVTNVRDALQSRLDLVDTNLKPNLEVDEGEDMDIISKSEATRIIDELREFMPTLNEMLTRHLPPVTRARRTLMNLDNVPHHVEHFFKSTAEIRKAQFWKVDILPWSTD